MGDDTFLSAEWRDLLMLNYEIDPRVLASRVPAGTELDFHEGRCFASMVGFRFLNARVLGVGIPFHRDFEEVNLRFYVRRRGPEGWRRGVVFVRELGPRPLIALVARAVYGEPYSALSMRHRCDGSGVSYEWRRNGAWEGMSGSADGVPADPTPGSPEEFITEHYWGYTSRRARCDEYEVEHPRWKVRRAGNTILTADIASLYGREFLEWLSVPPSSAFVAEGSPVTVRRGRRLS